MKPELKNHLDEYIKSKGYSSYISLLLDCDEIYSELVDEHRWWTEWFVVVEVNGKYVGFVTARTTGDMSAYDRGYEPDESSIVEVVAEQKVITVYKEKI